MNHIPRLVVAAAFALPLASFAQTPSVAPSAKVLPADAPRSNLEKQQTEQAGAATKYGETGSASNTQPSQTDATATKKAKKSKVKKSDTPDTTTDTAATPK